MNSDLRRSKRYDDFFPVSVLAQNKIKGIKTGPFAARIINISPHGACLLVSQGTLESNNIYQTNIENDSLLIEIQGKIPSDNNTFTLKGRPVRINHFILDDIKACTVGVDLISKEDQEHSEKIINKIATKPFANLPENMDVR